MASGIAAVLLIASLPGLVYQARDVDLLLYSAAAARANAEHALPYQAAWIEKGPVAMGLFQVLSLLFGNYNFAAIGAAWIVLALICAALAWALARECGASDGGAWAALLFAVSVGAVGGTLNTEIPAAAAAAGAVLVWCRTTGARRAAGSPGERVTMRVRARGRSPWAEVPENHRESRRPARLALAVLAGLLTGIAFLCRQNAGALWPLLIATEGAMVWAGRRSLRSAALAAVAISGGFLLAVGSVLILYRMAGALDSFWFCFYSYNADIYIAATKIDAWRLITSPLTAAQNFLLPVGTTAALGILGMLLVLRRMPRLLRAAEEQGELEGTSQTEASGVRVMLEDRTDGIRSSRSRGPEETGARGSEESGSHAFTAVAVVVCALGLTVSLFPGLRLFSHYFALPLPLWAVLGGLAVEALSGRAKNGESSPAAAPDAAASGRTAAWSSAGSATARSPTMRRLQEARLGRPAIVAALVCLSLLVELEARPWLETARSLREWAGAGSVTRWTDPLFWPGRDRFASKVAAYVREHSAPGDRIFVWGMRPHVYAYARRVPATRFVTCTFLTGLVPWERIGSEEDTSRWIVPGSWDLFMRELRWEMPVFIVDASRDHLFGMGAYAPEKFPPLAEFLKMGYDPVFEAGDKEKMIVWRSRITRPGFPRPGSARP